MNGTLAFLAAAWISAADQPVVERNRLTDDRRPEVQRAADGTSWFAARVVNERPVAKAVWKVSGLGVFDVYHDGRLVGDEILRPGYTHYAKTKAYYTYDLTDRWRRGVGETNDLSAVVSHGWWSDKIVNFAGRKPAFWSELSLAFADGSTKTVSTGDAVWRAGAGGPIAHAAIFDGEEYDARIAAPFRGEGLGRPEPNDEFRGELVPAEGGRVYLREDLVMRAEPFALSAGVTNVVDFGQNAAAVPRFRMRAKPGTRLTVLPAEMLNADGTVYRENLRIPDLGMRAVYTFGPAEGAVSYQPRHTYFGYRYLALTATGDVTFERIESVPVSSVTREMETLRLTTGHDALNRFLQNALWSMRANFLSVPTDCPQRNERLGWTGDAQVFAPTALYLCRAAGFYRKWMRDMRDSVHPNGSFASVAPYGQYGNEDRRIAFADAGVYVPYAVWKMTGDRRIVDENLAAMRRHLDCLDREGYDRSYQWADWLSFEKYESRSKAAFFVDAGGRRTGPRPEALRYWRYLGLCHRSRMWGLLAEMAGDAEARRRSAELRDEARREFFATPAGTIAAPFDDMQTPAVFALKCGLVEGAARRRTLTSLLDNIAAHGMCLQTGFFGTAELLDVLAVCGEYDTAYRLLTQRKCPSWLYQVDQGATTVWERWDSYTKVRGFGPADMNSFNHYAYGSVLAWIVGHAAGIRPDPQSAGFSRFLLAPVPDRRLGRLDCEYDSPVGKIRSSWRYEGDRLVWEYEVPEGAEAIVRRPDGAVTSGMTGRRPGLEFVSPPVEGHVHASTVLPVKDGYLAAWFEGSKESSGDVAIWGATRRDGKWSGKRLLAKVNPESAHWNPVLRRGDDGRICLYFKVGRNCADWRTYETESRDDGMTWSVPCELVPGDVMGGRGPVKNKCLRLKSGRLLAGASREFDPAKLDLTVLWRSFVDISDDDGRTWRRTEPFPVPADAPKWGRHPFGVIQPTLWEDADGVHALMRATDGWIWRTDSRDEGETWCTCYRSSLENINSGIDCVQASDGNLYLALNGVNRDPKSKNWGSRNHLEIKVSPDGGRTWKTFRTLADDALVQQDGRASEYSYPALIEARPGRLALTFTFNRRQIAFCELD